MSPATFFFKNFGTPTKKKIKKIGQKFFLQNYFLLCYKYHSLNIHGHHNIKQTKMSALRPLCIGQFKLQSPLNLAYHHFYSVLIKSRALQSLQRARAGRQTWSWLQPCSCTALALAQSHHTALSQQVTKPYQTINLSAKVLSSLLHLHINYCVQHRLVLHCQLHRSTTETWKNKLGSQAGAALFYLFFYLNLCF